MGHSHFHSHRIVLQVDYCSTGMIFAGENYLRQQLGCTSQCVDVEPHPHWCSVVPWVMDWVHTQVAVGLVTWTAARFGLA
uniref:Uncharacterized protein n=1 Tax=Anguilla anguilla TaxID=7936 RepID=A0A0E9RWM1_ANGAN